MDQPVSLYLDLSEGDHPDMEVVAEASAAFARLLREVVYLVDPSIEVRIELESGTEGSLSLNAIVRLVRGRISDPVARWAMLCTIATFLGTETIAALVGVAVSGVAAPEQSMSEADVERIADKVAQLVEKSSAKPYAQQVYRAVEKDPSIIGVGVTAEKGARPRSIVAREEFRQRAGFDVEIETDARTRTKTAQDVIVLVGPVLDLDQRGRKWRFLRDGEPFNATVADPIFLESVLTGRSKIPMVAGIELDAVLEIEETYKGNVWVVTDRRVLDVRGARSPEAPGSLFDPKGKP